VRGLSAAKGPRGFQVHSGVLNRIKEAIFTAAASAVIMPAQAAVLTNGLIARPIIPPHATHPAFRPPENVARNPPCKSSRIPLTGAAQSGRDTVQVIFSQAAPLDPLVGIRGRLSCLLHRRQCASQSCPSRTRERARPPAYPDIVRRGARLCSCRRQTD